LLLRKFVNNVLDVEVFDAFALLRCIGSELGLFEHRVLED
jgi:hypothetical protein